jgi:hypothetical protein
VTDNAGATEEDTATITVTNVAPIVEAGPDATIDEGGTFTGSGSFTDPGPDTWTATVDYGDGSGVQPLALNADKTFNLSRVYADNSSYTVTVTVTDDDSGVGNDTLVVTVNNVAPVVTAFTSSSPAIGGAREGQTVSVSATFTDPGELDTHTASIDWGDGTTSPAAVSEVGGSGTATTR